MVAVDFDNDICFFGANNVWFAAQDPTSGSGGIPLPATVATDWLPALIANSGVVQGYMNTGGLEFRFTPPAGYDPWDVDDL
jgi:hypothetical protein